MKYLSIAGLCLVLLLLSNCSKNNDNDQNDDASLQKQELSDFAHVLANPNYQDIQQKANALNNTVQTLQSSSTESNLEAARKAWRETRLAWEQAEGFLVGPVEDFNYDPIMDTWPLNKAELDSLLSSSNPLGVSDIELLPYSMKGFHAIEYILFGTGGSRKAASLTDREKQYLISLTQNLYSTTTDLRNSWDVNQPDNFTNHLVTAGAGSTRFQTRQDAFIAIVTSMAGICEEVADGKMNDPLVAQDSTLEESQFAHSSTLDFKNNMMGVQNAYICKYTSDGHGLNELVAAKNISLDNNIQSQINAVIASFDAIPANYGAAIYSHQVQIHNTQNLISTLRNTLENDLMSFIQTTVKE